MNSRDLTPLQEGIGVHFKNIALLEQALIHRSYLNEHRNLGIGHNERLEFLGDAVLELVVTHYLYSNYDKPEGDLTNWRAALVNSDMLALYAKEIGLEPYLYLSRGEEQDANSKARLYITANAFEAVIGAIYLDQGYEVARVFLERVVVGHLPSILERKLYRDPKSQFQEASQERLSITPSYEVLSESGPDHNKQFRVGVFLGDECVAEGEGSSKQEAQVRAAAAALDAKGWN